MEDAKRYQRQKLTLFFLGFLLSLLFLYLFITTGASRHLKNLAFSWTALPWLRILLFTGFLSLLSYCLAFPLTVFGGYVLEKKFDLSTLRFQEWFYREVKKESLSFLFLIILVEGGYALLDRLGSRWWLGFGFLWFLLGWVLTQLFPVWIVPLFFRYTPVEDTQLVELLRSFAQSQGRDIHSVRTIDLSRETRKANAAVLGMGKLKKIVLGDTLLKHFSHEEIRVVFAHELGHDKEHHMLFSLFFNALITFGGIYLVQQIVTQSLGHFHLSGLSDLAALPLFLLFLSLYHFFLMPVQNGFSRMMEHRADAFALRTTGMKDVFIEAMKKLAKQNLADETPHPWVEVFFYSHPSISRRIKFAEKF